MSTTHTEKLRMLHQAAQGVESRQADEQLSAPVIRQTFQRLRMVGLTTAEAGNLTAHMSGLRIASRAWTVHEIERLLFLRALVESGRLEP